MTFYYLTVMLHARDFHHQPVAGMYDRYDIMVHFDRSAVNLSNLKTILNYCKINLISSLTLYIHNRNVINS